jgi:hypothetical protein
MVLAYKKVPICLTLGDEMRKNALFVKKNGNTFCGIKKTLYLCIAIEKTTAP